MILGSFDQTVELLLIASGLAAAASAFTFFKRPKLSMVFLGLTAAFIFSFAAFMDPFLNLWDERIHALIAKNLISHPFKPTFYDDPLLNNHTNEWWFAHVWLYKQPYFLWWIALSIKILGPSEFAVRLPSILHGIAIVLATYRSGELMVNRRTGYLAAFMFITSVYYIDLIGGRQSLDHNDLMFSAYIFLSIWSFLEYNRSHEKKWIILTGAFSGFAILIKWLVGLLVYAGWILLKMIRKDFRHAKYGDILSAFIITLLIATPWQIYTFIRFPAEAAASYALNARHFYVPLDGHSGSILYHFNKFELLYGPFSSFLVIPGLIVLYRKMKDSALYYSLVFMILVSYLFFSIARTKMPSFVFINAMVIFIALSALIDHLLIWAEDRFTSFSLKRVVFLSVFAFIIIFRFNIRDLVQRHSLVVPGNSYSINLYENKTVFLSLELPDNAVLFNVPGTQYIEAMFYTGLPAYNFIPNHKQIDELNLKGKKVVIFQNRKELPEELLNNPSIRIIENIIEPVK